MRMIDSTTLQLLALPLLTGLCIAAVAGPLGSLVVWRRMAYFSDTLGHSLLLGVSLSVLFGIAPWLGALLCCAALSILLLSLQQRSFLNADAILGVLSHSSLALGLIFISVNSQTAGMINQFLFGDILATDAQDLLLTLLLCGTVATMIVLFWRKWIAITVHEDLARIEGLAIAPLKIALMLALAILVAIAMQIVGVLLISALLIIPAAAARQHATSPISMALIASSLGMLAVVCGLLMSSSWDTPAGPSIIAAAAAFFAASQLRTLRR
jgi:zinc transport system permease protein